MHGKSTGNKGTVDEAKIAARVGIIASQSTADPTIKQRVSNKEPNQSTLPTSTSGILIVEIDTKYQKYSSKYRNIPLGYNHFCPYFCLYFGDSAARPQKSE